MSFDPEAPSVSPASDPTPAAPAAGGRKLLPCLITGLFVCVVGTGLAFAGWLGFTLYGETSRAVATIASATAAWTAGAHGAATTLATHAQWSAVLSESFDSNVNRWRSGPIASEFGNAKWTIAGGVLQAELQSSPGLIARNSPPMDAVSDAFVGASGRRVNGAADASYGIVFRDDGRSYYYFSINGDKTTELSLIYQGEWTHLWTAASPAIRPGQPNRLAVDMAGPHFTLFVNDQFIGEFDDRTLTAGAAGLAATVYAKGEATLEFDDFELRVSPDAQSARQATATVRAGIPIATATAAAERASATIQAALVTAAAYAQLPLVISDTFASNANNWPVTDVKGTSSSLKRSVTNGQYRWEAQTTNGSTWQYRPTMPSVSDGYFAVDARRVSGSQGAEYGISFRHDGDNFYLFSAGDFGKFNLYLKNKGDWSKLIGDTTSTAIRPGEVNRLAVSAEGAHLTFYINGQYAAQIDDGTLSGGRAGLALDLGSGNEAVVLFDNFEVRARLSVQSQATVQAAQLTATAQAAASTATVQAAQGRAAAAALWRVVISDTFATNSHDWPVDDSTPNYGSMRASFKGGRYRWEANALKDVIWWEVPQMASLSDFALVAETVVVTNPLSAQTGVVFRKNGANYYAFQLRGDQTYRFQLNYGGQWTTLIARTGSPAIRPGELNRIKVIAEGAHFTLFINDEYVAEADDKQIDRGIAGLGLSLGLGDEAVFEFDSFEVRAP